MQQKNTIPVETWSWECNTGVFPSNFELIKVNFEQNLSPMANF